MDDYGLTLQRYTEKCGTFYIAAGGEDSKCRRRVMALAAAGAALQARLLAKHHRTVDHPGGAAAHAWMVKGNEWDTAAEVQRAQLIRLCVADGTVE
jgi:hypothetical protein